MCVTENKITRVSNTHPFECNTQVHMVSQRENPKSRQARAEREEEKSRDRWGFADSVTCVHVTGVANNMALCGMPLSPHM